MCPLSESTIAKTYDSILNECTLTLANPLRKFLRRGLKVTLGTNSPLHVHSSINDPVAEEYAVASQIMGFNEQDLSEVARNSVLISSFARDIKHDLIGLDNPSNNGIL